MFVIFVQQDSHASARVSVDRWINDLEKNESMDSWCFALSEIYLLSRVPCILPASLLLIYIRSGQTRCVIEPV